MSTTRRYRVWDPQVETLEDARAIDAPNIASAAEAYAEADDLGQCEGMYKSGHVLHVLDPNDDAHEAIVTMEMVPSYSGQVRRRI